MKHRVGARALALFFFPGHSGAWCAPPACRVPLHFCALPLARRHLSLPSLAGRLARRGVGVAPEFKRTAAVGGEVTACFEPSRHGRSAAGSGLDFAAQAALREAGGEAWLLRWQALRCVSSRAAKGTLEDRTTRVKTEKLSGYSSCTLGVPLVCREPCCRVQAIQRVLGHLARFNTRQTLILPTLAYPP